MNKLWSFLQLKTPPEVIHTHFREDVSEKTLDKSNFYKHSLFITFAHVYDLDIELELKYYASKG